MNDDDLRARSLYLPVPEFETTPFTRPPKLKDARVAIVTTAGLQRQSESAWKAQETGFRLLGSGERNLIVGNPSQNWDRSGAIADLNVVYPIDRLHELADDSTIGSVAETHISFQGAINDLNTVILDTGPAAAKVLIDDAVDVVILTPV